MAAHLKFIVDNDLTSLNELFDFIVLANEKDDLEIIKKLIPFMKLNCKLVIFTKNII